MASLELRSERYRIVFRFGGMKFQTPLKTTGPKEAQGCLARLEENLRLVERGRLVPPADSDLGTFLLSDGQLSKKPTLPNAVTLESLVSEYMAVHSNGALEKNTLDTRAMHLRHLTETLGNSCSLKLLKVADLQGHITRRSVKSSRHSETEAQRIHDAQGDFELSHDLELGRSTRAPDHAVSQPGTRFPQDG